MRGTAAVTACAMRSPAARTACSACTWSSMKAVTSAGTGYWSRSGWRSLGDSVFSIANGHEAGGGRIFAEKAVRPTPALALSEIAVGIAPRVVLAGVGQAVPGVANRRLGTLPGQARTALGALPAAAEIALDGVAVHVLGFALGARSVFVHGARLLSCRVEERRSAHHRCTVAGDIALAMAATAHRTGPRGAVGHALQGRPAVAGVSARGARRRTSPRPRCTRRSARHPPGAACGRPGCRRHRAWSDPAAPQRWPR